MKNYLMDYVLTLRHDVGMCMPQTSSYQSAKFHIMQEPPSPGPAASLSPKDRVGVGSSALH